MGAFVQHPASTTAIAPGDAAAIAKRLAQHYGEEARAIAMDRADALFDLGNAKGARNWLHIAEVIDEQQRKDALPL